MAVSMGLVGLLVAVWCRAASPAAATYADRLSGEMVARLFPAAAHKRVVANWPIVRSELDRYGVGDSKDMVQYALATVRVETGSFSPADEQPSRYSRSTDAVTYQGHSGETEVRPFGSYDSTLRSGADGKVVVNKHLGNCYNRGQDDALMRARHGDPPLPPCDDGELFRGRGFIQLTGRENYERMQRELGAESGLDLVEHPEVASTVPAAAKMLAAFLTHHRKEIERRMVAHDEAGARRVVNAAGLGAEQFSAFLKRARAALP